MLISSICFPAGENNQRDRVMVVGTGGVSTVGESDVDGWCYRDYERRGEVEQGCDRVVR